MNLYFAPLEGIGTYVYRRIHQKLFGGCDAYFAPFITPSDNERISLKCLRDILPENNENVNLKVQVLTNRADSFLKFEEKIVPLGYDSVNINLGCPSGTVCKKGRGSAFLKYPDDLDAFLEEIFSESQLNISVKKRIGFDNAQESDALTEIMKKHPLSLLIVHPRLRKDFYKGYPDIGTFSKIYSSYNKPLCYNGDIFSYSDYEEIRKQFPNLEGVMIGRGAITNPAIFREIKGGKRLSTSELEEFSYILIDDYLKVLGSDWYTLNRLKEIWLYSISNYPSEKKIAKEIKKAQKLSSLTDAIRKLPEIE
ncbi:MAG: tRNA-dihydrouridine synthase family protein [Clostridia bacterium]|nr:tRNA-dihydrouridine synthase family protein [Clostridia bacterium]